MQEFGHEFRSRSKISLRTGLRLHRTDGFTPGWELLSEVDYFHSFSMEEDTLLMKEICDKYNIRVSSISGHSPLMKPEAAVSRLTRSIIFADAVGAKFVNSDEMVKPEWMDDDFAHQTMKYTLTKAAMVAARHKVSLCIEPHGIYTKTAEGLLRIVDLVPSPWIGVNWIRAIHTWPESKIRMTASRW